MPEQRRKFSPQFKAEAVQMVLETGKPIAEVARDLEINEGALGNAGSGAGRGAAWRARAAAADDHGGARARAEELTEHLATGARSASNDLAMTHPRRQGLRRVNDPVLTRAKKTLQ